MENSVDLRMRGATAVDVASLPGTIHPFMAANKSLLQVLLQELSSVLSEKQAKKIVAYTMLNVLATVTLLLWCNGTNSMALTAYSYLTIFDIFRLLTCLVSLWVQQQKPTPIFSFGYERFEVLAVFASTILAQLGALFIMKESIERMLVQPEIHTGRLLVGTAVAFLFHMAVTYSMDNKAFNHIVAASSSSWLQEHVADMSESLCHLVPGLSKLLLPRINPFALIAAAGGIANITTYILIDMNNYYSADTWAAVWIAVMTVGTMFPMSVYSGKILLQTTPSHMIGQLDKVLREASTLDGVLEFRHEHFWTLAFGTMAGSVHVRVRRDADEQLVLAHVVNRLSNLISVLTVQIFKDDWARTSAYQIIGDTSLLNKLPSPARSPVNDIRPPTYIPGAVSPPSANISNLMAFRPPSIPNIGTMGPLSSTYTPRTTLTRSDNSAFTPVFDTLSPSTKNLNSFSVQQGRSLNVGNTATSGIVGSNAGLQYNTQYSHTGALRGPPVSKVTTGGSASMLSTSMFQGPGSKSFISDTLGSTSYQRGAEQKDTTKLQ